VSVARTAAVHVEVHTFIVFHLQLGEVVPKHSVVCVVAIVVGRPALLS
jgi:hypothetical protein